uniref:Rho-GAP domain-containing protein n=1 Tax=Petromyzon marinus TaxID=7757 RepID=S4R5C3_PETMA
RTFGVELATLLAGVPPGRTVPLVVETMVQFLEEHVSVHTGLESEGLFRVSGSVRAVERLRQAWEADVTSDGRGQADVSSVAGLLKLFLRELPDGVVPASLLPSFLQAHRDSAGDEMRLAESLRLLLAQLPGENHALLRYLCSFLVRVAQHQEVNLMSPQNLGTVFGPNFFRVSPGMEGIAEQQVVNRVTARFITDFLSIFQEDSPRHAHIILVQVRVSFADLEEEKEEAVRLGATEPHCARTVGKESGRSMAPSRTAANGEDMDSSHSDTEPFSRKSVVKNSQNDYSWRYSSPAGTTLDIAMQDGYHVTDESTGQSLGIILRPTRNKGSGRDKHCDCSRGEEFVLEFKWNVPSLLLVSGTSASSDLARTTALEAIGSLLTAVGGTARRTDVPLLDLAGIAPDTEWGEPVRLFRDWRSESSEPHLSPRPGRLIRRLLADEADPLLSPRCSSFSHSQRYHTDPEAPPSPPNLPSFMRPRSSSLGSREEEHDKEEVTSSQLSKRIQSLKKKIRRFEERFQEEHRYRPSHSDKVTNPEVLKWMNDLARSRKQLRAALLKRSLYRADALTRQRSNTLPRSFGSSRPCELRPTAEKPRAERPTVEQTMEAIELRLKEKRQQAARPDSPKEMTREQIAAEKVAIQKSLLYFESIHGRPTTRQEKHKVKPLYDRYRSVKTLLVRARAIPIIREPPLPAAPTAAAPVTTATPPPFAPRRLLPEDEEQDTDGFVSPLEESCGSSCKLARVRPDPSLSTLHAASREELMEHLRTTRSDKRRLRKLLRDFEDSFYRHTGRNVAKEDRSTLAEQYTEYKHAKAKLRLLEALIGKQGTSAVT